MSIFNDDTMETLALTGMFTVLRYGIQHVVQRVLKSNNLLKDDGMRFKFSESAWKLMYYSTMVVWGFFVVVSKDFFWNTPLCWIGWPNIPISDSYRHFYLAQLAFYLHSCLAQLTIEVVRKDFWQMLIHHIVTSFLIGVSYYVGYFRIGGLVLVLHDVSDVIMESGKMCLYAGYTSVADSLFVCFATSWAVTRLFWFPTRVLKSAMFESAEVLGEEVPYWWSLNGGLVVLQILNIFWFYLIVRMATMKIFNKGKLKDLRENDD